MKIGYILNDAMGFTDGAGVHTLPSQRIERYQRTLEDLEEKYSWKTQGTGAQFMHQVNPYGDAAGNAACRVTGLAAYADQIVYAADMNGEIGGLYLKSPEDLRSPEGLVVSDRFFHMIDLHVRGDVLYGAKAGIKGCRHIVSVELPGGRLTQLTEGDARERHPFVSADGRYLYFDSAGYFRDEERHLAALGPSQVMELDLAGGQLKTVLADEKQDFCKLTMDMAGEKYVMRRPYEPPRPPRANPLGCLTAPFSALAGFVHVFSAINAQRKGNKPPMPTVAQGAPSPKGEDWIGLDGWRVDAAKALRENQRSGEAYPGVAPRDWVLLRLKGDGVQQVVRQGVVDYLLLPEGGYVYTNGLHIVQVDAQGRETLLCKDRLFSALALLP